MVVEQPGRRLGEADRAASSGLPAAGKQPGQISANLAPDQVSLHVVKGLVRLASAHAQRVRLLVVSIVPAVIAQIQPAEERELAVDHDELLMMRALVDVTAVEQKRELFAGGPVELLRLHPLALQGEHGMEVPRED